MPRVISGARGGFRGGSVGHGRAAHRASTYNMDPQVSNAPHSTSTGSTVISGNATTGTPPQLPDVGAVGDDMTG